MSSSSEGLRDERRICRIGWTILACGSPTSHMRPLAMDDALPLLIALSAGATAMMVRPRAVLRSGRTAENITLFFAQEVSRGCFETPWS